MIFNKKVDIFDEPNNFGQGSSPFKQVEYIEPKEKKVKEYVLDIDEETKGTLSPPNIYGKAQSL